MDLSPLPLLIFQIDETGTVKGISGGLTRVFGIDESEAIGKSLSSVKELQIKKRTLKNILAERQLIISFSKDDRTYEIRTFPNTSDAQPTITGYIEDITERVLKEQTFDDSQFMAITAQRLKSLEEISGGIAHEINNPPCDPKRIFRISFDDA